MNERDRLNPATYASIENAGSRSTALLRLEGMLGEVSRKMADAVRNKASYLSGTPHEMSYFEYLCVTRNLIDEMYPPPC